MPPVRCAAMASHIYTAVVVWLIVNELVMIALIESVALVERGDD
jgi:hypothetical protein